MKLRVLVPLFLLFFLVALALQVPARVVLERIPLPVGVVVSEVRGTLWAGEATVRRGGVTVPSVQWRLRPQSLVRLAPAAEIRARLPGGFARAELALSPAGLLHLRGLSATLDAASPLLAARLPLPLTGQFLLDVGYARIAPAGLVALEAGVLDWQQAGVVFGSAQALGAFRLDLSATDGRLEGTIRDSGGPLEAQGTLAGEGRQVRLELGLRARPEAPPALRDALPMLGRAGPDGRVSLRHTLSLPVGLAPAGG